MKAKGFGRVGVWLLLVAVLAVMLAAPVYAQRTMVVSWNMPHLNDEDQAAMKAEFEELHGVTLEWAPRDPQQLITMFVGGMQLDVLQVNAGENLNSFVQRGMLRPLDEYFERSPEVVNRWVPNIMEAVKIDGKAYWVPRGEIDALSLLWTNQAVLQEAGVAMPSVDWTFSDFESLGAKVRRDRDGNGQVDTWLSSYWSWLGHVPWFFNGGGRYVYEEDPAKSAIADEASIQAIEWIQSTIETGLMPTRNDLVSHLTNQSIPAVTAMVEGMLGMATEGARKAVPEMRAAGVAGAVTLVPGGPGGQISTGELQGFGISSTSKDPDLAWEWLKFISQEKYWVHWLDRRFTPTLDRELTDDFIALDPGIDQFGEAFLAFFQRPFVLYRPIVPGLTAPIHNEMFGQVLSLEKPAAAAAREIDAKVQAAIDAFYSGVQ